MSIVLALDIGTTSLSALAYEPVADRVLAVRTRPNDAGIDGLPGNRHEQDPPVVRDGAFELLAGLLSDPAVDRSGVSAIALTGQMHGLALIDTAGGTITNLITWRDQRLPVAAIPSPGDAGNPGLWASDTGCALAAGYGGVTLSWLSRQGCLAEPCTALTIADYLAFSLCGVRATDSTHAASWGILNIHSRSWHPEALKGLEISPSVLPEIHDGGAPLGPLTAEAAARLGLEEHVGVHTPIGDNQASVIGAAGLDGDAVVLNLGTGGQISMPVAEFTVHEELETRPMPTRGHILVGVSLCGGDAYAHLMRFFREAVFEITGEQLPKSAIYERMNALAASGEPGADGLQVDTRFAGTRSDPSLRGTIQGIGLSNWTPGNLVRSVSEGMVRELAEQVPEGVIGADIRRVVASGNGVTRNAVVRQTIEGLFSRPCEIRNEPEEAARGVAMLVGAGIG